MRRPGKAERRSNSKSGATEKDLRGKQYPQVRSAPCRVFGPSTKRGSAPEGKATRADANGRQVFRLVSVKARTRPAFPFLSEQWQMAGALAHTAAVPHGIDYPFPFSFRQAEHLPFDF